MLQIITDGTQLLYECFLCHKYKPRSQVDQHSDIYVCKSCNEITPMEFTIIPISVQKPITLPSFNEFNLFYDDILFYKSEPISSLINNIITITNLQTKKSIQIDINALLQLLCDKFNHPVIYESDMAQNIDFQLYIQDLYLTVQEKVDQSILKYNKIFAFEDVRIKDLCISYHEMMSIPLNLKLQYQDWEKTLISGHISREIAKEMSEKNKQIVQIQIDYSKKLSDEGIKNNTILEKYKNEINRLNATIESLNSSRASAKDELNIIRTEKDELYTRYKDLELQLQEKIAEATKLSLDVTKLKKEVDKHKETEEWTLDITSTEDEKIYFNQITNKHITCPRDFKENYRPGLNDIESDILIYKNKETNEIFEVPKTLLKFMRSMPDIPINGNTITEGIKLKDNTLKVINVLSRFKENALTKEQIVEKAAVPKSHVMDHIKEGTKAGKIIMFEDEEGDRRYYLL